MEPEEYMVWTNIVFILLLEYFTFMEKHFEKMKIPSSSFH